MARTVWSSFGSLASRDSMMMLLTPNWSIMASISFSTPAVMDSMATTAPTPKIMPSMVSRLRSLWTRRLESPMYSSGKYPESIDYFPLPAGAAPAEGMPTPGLDEPEDFSFLSFFFAVGSPSAMVSPGFRPSAMTETDSLRLASLMTRSSKWLSSGFWM